MICWFQVINMLLGLQGKIMMSWIGLILEKLVDRVIGGGDKKDKKIIVLNEAVDFLEKLKECETTSFVIVKDPYGLVFGPYYLLWFEKDNTTYRIFVSPDSAIWGRIQYHLEISFPSEDGSWAQEVPYEKIKKFL